MSMQDCLILDFLSTQGAISVSSRHSAGSSFQKEECYVCRRASPEAAL